MSEIAGPDEHVFTAMVTPFTENGEVNYDAAGELALYLVEHGSDGLVLAGTTGESPVIDHEAQIRLFNEVRDAVGDGVTLIGGTGSNNTIEAVHLTKRATQEGAVDSLLVVSPYYNRPSQYGIRNYYEQVAGATDLPVILYNIPGRTGRLVEPDTIRALVDAGHVQGLKDATGNVETAKDLHGELGDDLEIFSGDDALNLAFFRAGAKGAISVASHWAGAEMTDMYRAEKSGSKTRADRIASALASSARFETSHIDPDGLERDVPNPGPTKVMMAHILGKEVVGECLSPMLMSPEDLDYLERRAPQILTELAIVMGAINREMPSSWDALVASADS